jgi:hypothetical protein
MPRVEKRLVAHYNVEAVRGQSDPPFIANSGDNTIGRCRGGEEIDALVTDDAAQKGVGHVGPIRRGQMCLIGRLRVICGLRATSFA